MDQSSLPPLSQDLLQRFDTEVSWYIGHVRSLAMTPEECCADQGNYLVAGELFYFLLQPTSLLTDPSMPLSGEQKSAIEMLRQSVRLVPLEARSGGPNAAASLKDMQHPSWEGPRQSAAKVLTVMAPLLNARAPWGMAP
jgi:hypothetical protein